MEDFEEIPRKRASFQFRKQPLLIKEGVSVVLQFRINQAQALFLLSFFKNEIHN